MIVARSAINEGYDATDIPSYGPQSRGGTSYADVHVAREEVLSPAVAHPHVLVAFNVMSLAKFGSSVRPGGVVIYDNSMVTGTLPPLSAEVRVVPAPLATLAKRIGTEKVKNIVALGVLQAATQMFPVESLAAAIRMTLSGGPDQEKLNRAAFAAGVEYVEPVAHQG